MKYERESVRIIKVFMKFFLIIGENVFDSIMYSVVSIKKFLLENMGLVNLY